MKKAILVVSFGTSYHDTLEKTILATEEAIAQANPGWEVRRAFTSAITMRKLLARDNLQIDNVSQAMAKLEAEGKLKAVVTQNIDGLHQKAGSRTVFELHGSVLRNYCMDCGEFYDLDYVMDDENCEGNIPKCRKCGGIVKPDVVLYEEALDEDCMMGAIRAIQQADTMIIGGTSLVVYPAAGLIRYFGGKKLVLINKQATPYDGQADLVINDSIGKVMDLD